MAQTTPNSVQNSAPNILQSDSRSSRRSRDRKPRYFYGLGGPVELQRCIYAPYSLRATTATLLLDGNADIVKVKDLLGHRHVTTTQIYDKRRRSTSESAKATCWRFDAQRLAGHADPRTTRLYDRRDKKITRNIVERILI
jgi:integrase